MRLTRAQLFIPLALALAACASGPKVVAGDQDTVTVEADPLDDVAGFADSYCQRYGKHAKAMGDISVGPSTAKRLYDFNCVGSAE